MPVLAFGLSVLITEDQLWTDKRQNVDRTVVSTFKKNYAKLIITFKILFKILKWSHAVSPHHSLHSVASRCRHSDVHSRACLSSRSRSCPPVVHGRYNTQSRLGATACRSQRAQHRQQARQDALVARSDGTTWREWQEGGWIRIFMTNISR